MKKFIGRTSELKTLEKEYHREAGFVVISGFLHNTSLKKRRFL